MKQYCIWLVQVENYVYNQCFADQAIPLQAAFKDLGYKVPIVYAADFDRCNIILGGHLLKHVPDVDCIVWNLEQIAPDVPWMTKEYVNLLRSKPTWDYCRDNVEKIGVKPTLMPVGYHDCMRTIERVEPEIDVLHFGSMNERRAQMLNRLEQAGLRTMHLFGAYGAERNSWIAKSKMVINIAFYESKIFNIARCATLFANAIPVVSEKGPGSEPYHVTGQCGEYDELVDICLGQVSGEKGFEVFSGMNQVNYLKAVL